jgi:secreted PhoX family phosphatase
VNDEIQKSIVNQVTLSRRRLLSAAVAGLAGAVVVPRLAIGAAAADVTGTTSARGLFGGPTTLDRTVVKQVVDQTLGYVRLIEGPGEARISRPARCSTCPGRPPSPTHPAPWRSPATGPTSR